MSEVGVVIYIVYRGKFVYVDKVDQELVSFAIP